MNPTLGIQASHSPQREAGFWVAGLAFTFVLFFVLAHVEYKGGPEGAVEIEDMPVTSIFLPPPPPKAAEPVPQALPDLMPMPGIDREASDSPVRIAIVPPDITALMPSAQVPPRATVTLGLQANIRPNAEVTSDLRQVYQEYDVDQRPQAVVRVAPEVTDEMFGSARSLRVTLLVLIETDGHAGTVHVVKTSGKAAFDELVAQTVKNEWLFSPAVRRGRKVRCLALQALRFNSSSGNPFTVDR
jgi:outer membrane biosynthesis protein TonB